MTAHDLRSAWLAVRENDHVSAAEEQESAWWRAVSELLWSDAPPDMEVVRALKHSPVASAATCATSATPAMLEALQSVPRGPQKASVLTRLAQWWINEFGENDDPEWRSGLEHYRQSLRAIRGIGPETADRLLVFAGNLSVFPVDRAILRIAVRHGWLDWPVDDEAAQATFLSAFDSDPGELQRASRKLRAIGAKFCGRVPQCDLCPFVRFLSEKGPLYIDQC
jgi:endonuclease III